MLGEFLCFGRAFLFFKEYSFHSFVLSKNITKNELL